MSDERAVNDRREQAGLELVMHRCKTKGCGRLALAGEACCQRCREELAAFREIWELETSKVRPVAGLPIYIDEFVPCVEAEEESRRAASGVAYLDQAKPASSNLKRFVWICVGLGAAVLGLAIARW